MPSTDETLLEERRLDGSASISDATYVKDTRIHKKNDSPFKARFHGGWRTGVAWGALSAVIVLVVNVSFLIWITSKYSSGPNGSTTIFKGSCKTKTNIFRWSHLLINICSTLLLGASNNAMQCLSAPTRAEVDKAHEENTWLDIGIQSVKNLLYVGRLRSTLWTAILISSIPLHLFYNSVITSSISTNDYMIVLAAESFTSGAAFDRSYKWSAVDTTKLPWFPAEGSVFIGPKIDYDEISAMQSNLKNLTRLNNTECASIYSTGLLNDFGNVLLVTNTSNTNSILNIYAHGATSSPAMPWFCGDTLTTNISCAMTNMTDNVWPMSYSSSLPADASLYNESFMGVDGGSGNLTDLSEYYDESVVCSWTDERDPNDKSDLTDSPPGASVEYMNKGPDNYCILPDPLLPSDPSNKSKAYYSPVQDATTAYVQHCLAQKRSEYCEISVNSRMLIVVIICNAVKALSFVLVLLLPNFTPIVCIGDAISSFLERPDPWTLDNHHAVASSKVTRKGWLTTSWSLRHRRWFHGATPRQWYQGYLLLGALWLSSLVFIIQTCITDSPSNPITLTQMWMLGFGSDAVHSSNITSRFKSSSIFGTALLVNSPQLLASATYLSYNLLMTSMVMTAECNDFALHRKTLRISQPRGKQRSTYYLQLPYRYAIPLMITCGVLHWLISQSLFLVELLVQGLDGKRRPDNDIIACGWSPLALLFVLLLGGAMLLALLLVGGLRRYSVEMPIMRSHSLRISAACHLPKRGGCEEEDVALQPIQYGVVEDAEGEEGGQWRACFTSREDVVPLTTRVSCSRV